MKADFRGSQSPVNTREGKRTSIPAPDGDVAIRVPDETLIVRSPIGRGAFFSRQQGFNEDAAGQPKQARRVIRVV